MSASITTSQRELLSVAIESATSDRLRITLQRMCDNSVEAFRLASEQLLTHGPVEENGDEAGQVDESTGKAEISTGGSRGQKRGLDVTRQRYQVCVQCDEEYDVEEDEREEALCYWHEGDLEVYYDDDFWADHDEQCHGIIDTDEMRKEYPEGFMWSCCQKLGNAEGCMITKHEPPAVPSKRIKT